MRLTPRLVALAMLVAAAVGCDDDNDPGLTANAGPDREVATGVATILDGDGSADDPGATLTYAWTVVSKPEGSTAELLSDATAENPTFTPDVDGRYELQLVVSDGTSSSEPDVIVLTARQNAQPVADAGLDAAATVGIEIVLDGTNSSDGDGDDLTYAWTIATAPAGSSAALSDATIATPAFTPDVAGAYTFELIVSDGLEQSSPDQVVITAAAP